MIEDVTIRRVGEGEVALLARLRREWTDEDAAAPVADDGFEERFAAWFAEAAGERVTWLASAGDRPVGMLNMAVFHRMPRPGRPDVRWGYVANVFVLAKRRSQGVGAQLLAAAVEHARRERFVRIVLNPSRRSVPFYRRAGFSPADSLMIMNLD